MQLQEKVAFTKHARERIEQRKISEKMVLRAIAMPYRSYTQKDGSIKFVCRINRRVVHVVCQPIPAERKWLVITVWVRGEDDKGNSVKGVNDGRILSFNMMVLLFILIIMIIAFLFLYANGI
ncbi:MAG: hypothetical protein Phog2KO_47150 [Phototrophicaceae bacterium]